MRATLRLLALLWIAPAAAFAQTAPPAGADPAGPRAVVDQTVADVLAVLNDPGISPSEQRRRVEEIAYSIFDFPTMSRLVLARNWKRLSPEQRGEFQRLFRRFLANNYRDRIDGYEQEQVALLGEREEPRGDVTVRTRIVGGRFDGTNIDYRLRHAETRWLVIDVVVEGISLVSNYRDQFREVLSAKGGPDHLLEKLRKRNAESAASADAAS